MAERNGRKSNGQFARGHCGGPGRPPRDVETDYLAALSNAVTPDKWQKIVQRALTDAEAGDRFARDWLSKYLISDEPAAAISVHSETSVDSSAVVRELLNHSDFLEFQEQQALEEDCLGNEPMAQ